jgi:hypothetical protein
VQNIGFPSCCALAFQGSIAELITSVLSSPFSGNQCLWGNASIQRKISEARSTEMAGALSGDVPPPHLKFSNFHTAMAAF